MLGGPMVLTVKVLASQTSCNFFIISQPTYRLLGDDDAIRQQGKVGALFLMRTASSSTNVLPFVDGPLGYSSLCLDALNDLV